MTARSSAGPLGTAAPEELENAARAARIAVETLLPCEKAPAAALENAPEGVMMGRRIRPGSATSPPDDNMTGGRIRPGSAIRSRPESAQSRSRPSSAQSRTTNSDHGCRDGGEQAVADTLFSVEALLQQWPALSEVAGGRV